MPPRPLIPRTKLFGNPSAAAVKLSPDGRWLSWLAPVEGVMNVWLAPAGDKAAAEPLTRTKGRPINHYQWSRDSRYVLFQKDETGDENYHIFVTDPATRELRDLTPIAGVNARVVKTSRLLPGRILVGLNDRDPHWHDIHAVDLASGERSLVWENTQQLLSIGFDWHLAPRYGASGSASGGSTLWRIDGSAVSPWMEIGYEDNLGTGPFSFAADNRRLLMMSSVGRETSALLWHDLASGAEAVIVEHPKYDVSGIVLDPVSYEVEAASVAGPRDEWVHVAPALKADFDFLRQRLAGFEVSVSSQTEDDRKWVVAAHKAESPATYHLFDRDRHSVEELMSARPELQPYRLAPMHPVSAKARDGLALQSYLTLPAEIEGERPAKPLPMVLYVHGGPWARDGYGYNAGAQWLADRGYAVLQVNYRGSTGFGKAFVRACEKQHAAAMHNDLIDMVEWAVREGIADRGKVAIFGGSYGGYASFVGATFTPDTFCCAVPVVGITNLQTLLESVPPYWAGFKEFMYRSYGDPRTEEGRRLLAERSPINKVDNIKRPMLIFHGQNDVRCKVAESDTIVAAMQRKGIPVTYVVYPDEGHGFHKPANRLAYIAIAEAFFSRHLGGSLEPMGDDLKASSHQIRAGADLLADLGVS
jgi:acylaminoacyl-peptidase